MNKYVSLHLQFLVPRK